MPTKTVQIRWKKVASVGDWLKIEYTDTHDLDSFGFEFSFPAAGEDHMRFALGPTEAHEFMNALACALLYRRVRKNKRKVK
jgi:hypothetical protein